MLTSPIFKMPVTDHTLCEQWRRSDKGTQLFACRNCPCIRAFQQNTAACDWCNLFLWSSPITSNKAMQTVTVEAMLLLTSKLPVMCLNVNITLQWGRKQTWPMQELGACVHSVYQALFPPPPYESAGTRLKFTMTLLYIHKHYHWLPYQPHR